MKKRHFVWIEIKIFPAASVPLDKYVRYEPNLSLGPNTPSGFRPILIPQHHGSVVPEATEDIFQSVR